MTAAGQWGAAEGDIARPVGPAPSFPPGGAAQDGGADLQEAQGEGGLPRRRGLGAPPYRRGRDEGGLGFRRRRGMAADGGGWRQMEADEARRPRGEDGGGRLAGC